MQHYPYQEFKALHTHWGPRHRGEVGNRYRCRYFVF